VFRLLSWLPLPILYGITASAVAILRLVRWRRGILAGNLERCFPDMDTGERQALIADNYRYLGHLVAEVVHGFRIDPSELASRVRFENPELVRELLAQGRRVLLTAGHHCNWEWLLLACSREFGVPLTAAYKPPPNKRLDKALTAMRSRLGATMVGAKALVQHLIEQRGQARLLAILADQSPAARSANQQSAWVTFFGQQTAFLLGPGWISAKMGYAPLFAAMRREGTGRYVVRLVPLTGPEHQRHADQVLGAYVRELERHIREYPVEYLWIYNRWKRERPLYA